MRPLTALAAGLLLAAPGLASARQKLAVVSLSAPPLLKFTGKSVSEAIAEAAIKDGRFEVIGPDAAEKKLGREAYDKLVECGPDPVCIADRGAPLKADRVIAGTLGQTEIAYKVDIVHVDAKSQRVLASIDREILIASRRLKPDVVAATPDLLKGHAEATSQLAITTERPGASVTVDDEPAGETPLMLTVKPGKHKVLVAQKGYFQQDAHYVDVPPGARVDDKVKLFAIPGAAAPPELAEPKPPPQPAAGEGIAAWPGYTALGLGAAALAFGGLEGAAVKRFDDSAVDKNKDGRLDVTRQAALDAQSQARLANGFMIGGGALVAVGAGLMAWHLANPGSGGDVAVTPSPNGLAVGGKF